ncbi:IMP dehydrogenase [Candidatus Jorgensenbacteria bacterium]|nr:IMP dehydrogenase [Candidatus Jorgensenbacteria bacterium]
MTIPKLKTLVRQYMVKKGLFASHAVTFADAYIIDETSRINKRSDIKNLSVSLAPHIKLNIPIVSANMADVTESAMAIALARLGGIGFIHQFLPLKKRVEEVEKVKRADNEMIKNPWTVTPDNSFLDTENMMSKKGISGVLVVDREGRLKGIISSRDTRFIRYKYGEKIEKLFVKDIMTPLPLITALPTITTTEAVALLQKHKVEKLPLVDHKGRLKGLITAKDILKKVQFENAARDKKGRLLVGATVGVSHGVLEETEALIGAGADIILVDTARANSYLAVDAVRMIRKGFSKVALVVGNVDTPEGALLLVKAGADGVKVGIGPGSACKTRIETGVGVPQLTAIAECAAITKAHDASLIADGGISTGGEFAKALVAGADSVMLGGLFAGTEESPGEVYYDAGERFKVYRGSAALDTQISRVEAGDLDHVRAPEGVSRKVSYKGESVEEIIKGLLGNVRSSMSYADAFTVKEFQERKFRLQSEAGHFEGRAKI